VLTAIGDSITAGVKLPDPQNVWPFLVGRRAGIPVNDLAISGIDSIGAQTRELPDVPPNTTLAVVYLGSNDALAIAGGNATLASEESAYRTIVTTLQGQGILVYTVQIRRWESNNPQVDVALAVDTNVNLLNAFVATLPGTGKITLDQYPDTYNPIYFDSQFLHPNDPGNALLAQHIGDQISTIL